MASEMIIPGVVNNYALAEIYDEKFIAAKLVLDNYRARNRGRYIPSWRKPVHINRASDDYSLYKRLRDEYLAAAIAAESAHYDG